MVSQGMEHLFPDQNQPDMWHELYELGDPDLKKYSEGLGAEAYTFNSPAEFTKIMPTVLSRANNDNIPQVIIVNINKQAIPPYYNRMYPPKK